MPPTPGSSRLKRAVLACIGILFVGVAGIGVFLPGIPTVGPLILASLFLTKSSPRLERRLVRNPFFAKYLPYLDGTSEMSTRARLISILLMWTSIGVSCLLLRYVGNSPVWITWIIVLAGLVGTLFILRFGKSGGGRSMPVAESRQSTDRGW
ncbi:MAG: YbaN family protein [Mariniblastus sp.]|nr:YbaN family protein [Mariniblastus sp.]